MLTSKPHADGIVLPEGSKAVDELSTAVNMDVISLHACGSELSNSAVCILSFPPKFQIHFPSDRMALLYPVTHAQIGESELPLSR